MGPSVPQESQQLVCVCANEFAQTLPIYMDASARRRTTAAKLLSKDEARRIAANIAKLQGAVAPPQALRPAASRRPGR
jgi:hypothetical protein